MSGERASKATVAVVIAASLAMIASPGLGSRMGGAQAMAQVQQGMPQSNVPGGRPVPPSNEARTESNDPSAARMHDQQEKNLVNERYKRMVDDSNKLLQLATELKAEVDKSTKNETPLSAYRKADEIERLAHDVKQRIRN